MGQQDRHKIAFDSIFYAVIVTSPQNTTMNTNFEYKGRKVEIRDSRSRQRLAIIDGTEYKIFGDEIPDLIVKRVIDREDEQWHAIHQNVLDAEESK